MSPATAPGTVRFTVVGRPRAPEPAPSRLQRLDASLPQGPRLQFLNLGVLFAVAYVTVDYPNAASWVLLNVSLGALLDALASRYRYGAWRVPWPTMVATLGVSLGPGRGERQPRAGGRRLPARPRAPPGPRPRAGLGRGRGRGGGLAPPPRPLSSRGWPPAGAACPTRAHGKPS